MSTIDDSWGAAGECMDPSGVVWSWGPAAAVGNRPAGTMFVSHSTGQLVYFPESLMTDARRNALVVILRERGIGDMMCVANRW